MSKFIRHKKKDANHKLITEFFQQSGAVVDDVSGLSGLGYDLVLNYRQTVVLVEVKNGELAPSARKLTESEEAAKARHGSKFAVIESIKEASGLLQSIREYECSARSTT